MDIPNKNEIDHKELSSVKGILPSKGKWYIIRQICIYVLQINTVLNRYIILLPHIPMLIGSYEEVDPKLS